LNLKPQQVMQSIKRLGL